MTSKHTYIKGDSTMENEALFSEEFEPPGMSAGVAHSDGSTETFYASSQTLLTYPAVSSAGATCTFRFKESQRSRTFRRRFYPHITANEWNDWTWQFRNRIRDGESLAQILWLSENEREAMDHQGGSLPVAITPYYASLLDEYDTSHPLRRMVVPTTNEYSRSSEESTDPLCEEQDSPVPGIIHRYPDRVLFLVTDTCSSYCRYCTRSRMVGGNRHSLTHLDTWERAINYIKTSPQVRDVLLSGGDPLTLPDDKLEWLLTRLRQIPHVEILRIGTKIPTVLPHRITPSLTYMLKRFHPLWISIHVNHPDELTLEMHHACVRLANAGIPLGSQTVLLRSINDDIETMKRLMHGLLKMRVKPYYLYQCDPIPGSSHFRTPVQTGLTIMEGLRGHTTGYAVPTYVIDAPGGGGKIPILPNYIIARNGNDLILRNYKGNIYRYPDEITFEEEVQENFL